MEVSFYHLTSLSLERALPRLLEKVYATGARVVIFFDHKEQLERIDEVLWTYGQMDFLPHGTYLEKHPEKQPIYLTVNDENPGNADILVQMGHKEHPNIKSFRRIVDIFENVNPLSVQNARDRYKRYKEEGHTLTYWKQDPEGKWKQEG